MLDPFNITDYNRSRVQLEEFLLFCIAVAGKKATMQAARLDRFLQGNLPFAFIRSLHKEGGIELVRRHLEQCGMGQYGRIGRAFVEVATDPRLNLRTCGWLRLIQVHGVGLKTAKFFLLHSRAGERHAVLDRHILAELKRAFPRSRVPAQTPDGEEYFRLEKLYFRYVDAQPGRSAAEVDLAIWKKAAA